MLESTLQEINLSLKEIVKALGNLCKIAKEPLEVDAIDVTKEVANEVENSIQSMQQVAQVQQPIQIQTNVVPQAPTQMNAQVIEQVSAQVPQAPIPTTQVTESFTQEQLAVAMSNAVAEGKMNVIQGVLQSFGVQALTQINPADYNKVATMLKEAGVQI